MSFLEAIIMLDDQSILNVPILGYDNDKADKKIRSMVEPITAVNECGQTCSYCGIRNCIYVPGHGGNHKCGVCS